MEKRFSLTVLTVHISIVLIRHYRGQRVSDQNTILLYLCAPKDRAFLFCFCFSALCGFTLLLFKQPRRRLQEQCIDQDQPMTDL